MSEMRLRSPLGRALGLGSAKEGVGHWWMVQDPGLAAATLTSFWETGT